ncbi:MAG TPA: ATP-binding protein [Symbiobacteriaceae bacterium]|nr:ATP-binding protein [Symbiobacteriaceae bacterium]
MTWNLLGKVLFWMFTNLMVGVGLVSLATYPPVWRRMGSARSRYWRDVAAASVMAVFCMFVVWEPGPGLKMDIRMVPLGLAGWTHGLPAAAFVGAVIIVARAIMGGAGVVTTVYFTIFCVAMIPLFHGRPKKWQNLALMGCAQTAAGYMVGQIVHAQQPPGLESSSPIWLGLAAIQVISLWVIQFQVENLDEKQRLQVDLARALRSKVAMLQVTPHAIFVLDGGGRVTDANEAARRLIGCDSLPPEVRAHPDVAAALEGHRGLQGCRVSVPDARGAERIMLVSTVPLEDGSMLLGMENVTKVIRQEREEARRDRLELLGRMAAMAAHEIKNPLTTIKGFLQLLSNRPEFASHRSTFALVQGEVAHINRVIGDFLDLSRTTDQQMEGISVDGLLQEVLAGMELQFPDSGVAVVLEGQAGLQVTADRKSLKQILRNLIANAYEAMPAGGRLLLVREAGARGVCLSVTDSGTGIAPDVLANLFTPYMTTKSTGTGLGLAISHKLAVELGADLSVSSAPGRGTTFRLQMPFASPMVNAAAGELLPD